MTDAPTTLTCPRCRGNDVTTLRVVFEEAMQRLKQNPDDGQARLLAQQFAPPRPRNEQKSFTLVIVLLAALVISVLIARVPSIASALHGFPLWLVFAVPGVMLTMASLIQSTHSTTWNQKQLPKAVRAWAERCVCRNCGTTFIAAVQGASAPAPAVLVPSPGTPGEG